MKLLKFKYILFAILAFFVYRSTYSNLITVLDHNNKSKSIRDLSLLTKSQECRDLRLKLKSTMLNQSDNWSLSLVSSTGDILIDINGNTKRIPASNQKLLSSAFALDKLGEAFRLRTTVIYRRDGIYEIIGSGDPDIGLENMQSISSAIVEHFYRNKLNLRHNISIYLNEVPPAQWWPADWIESDRYHSYGAPITSLALSSNANEMAMLNPLLNVKSILSNQFQVYGLYPTIKFNYKSPFRGFVSNKNVIYSIESAPMSSLLTLTNSESHNFLAEVLLRHAALSWNIEHASLKLMLWLKSLGLNTDEIYISDGSGLSRTNQISTNFLASFLYRFSIHRDFSKYLSSMAIIGKRGTLRFINNDPTFNIDFIGKTGTLSDVRSLTGMLKRNEHSYFLSIICNGEYISNPVMMNVLRILVESNKCLA